MKKQEWTITALKMQLDKDLKLCNSIFEQSMCKTIGVKEIRELAIKIKKARKLTPCETAILESL